MPFRGQTVSLRATAVYSYLRKKSPCLTPHPRYVPGMSTVQEIENAISRLSPEEMRLVRDGWKTNSRTGWR